MEQKLIERDADILGGTPIFVGTRVPAQTLIDYLEAGENLDDFLNDFPSVKREQVIALLENFKRILLTQTYESAA